jgi:O-antigen/teichoic acid export membrane protein/glycosyltransferase involved in cell wall biosynthesis
MSNPLLLFGAGAALGLLALAARRPGLTCALLALAIPLSAGIGRGAIIPLLRVNEAMLLVVAAGFVVHRLTSGRPLTYTGLDVAILAFCLINIVVPSGVIVLSRTTATLDDWLVVLAPLQYLMVYVVYSRTEFEAANLRLFFNACMLASILVAAVAVAEALNLGGVRGLMASYYPAAPRAPGDTVYRPTSMLGHYSAVGAFGLLNLLLALALAAVRQPGFPRWWLALVMGANLLSLVASETYAPVAALPLAAAAALLVVRRVPWSQLAAGLPVLPAVAVVLWPSISGRVGAQFSAAGGYGLPETLMTRIDYWQNFFIPALLQHGPWLGTGTLMPAEVPRPLVSFIDNDYLWQLFRAGVPGLAALVVMLASVAAVAWATRTSDDPRRRVLGAVCLGAVVSVVVLDTTSEYLTFTAVSQELWMLVGLLSGAVLASAPVAAESVPEVPRRAPAPAAVMPARPISRQPVDPIPLTSAWRVTPVPAQAPLLQPSLSEPRSGPLRAALSRLGAEQLLLRSSLAVLVGFGLARALGFLFQVTAGRVLSPDGFGQLTYALAVTNVATVLLTTAPLGLSRFLSRSGGNRSEQEVYYVNWLAVVGLVLGVSAVVTAAFATSVGLGGWLLVGLLANLLGVTALETYREVQRGLGRYLRQAIFYVLANVLQLAVVLVAAVVGWRSPALFLVVYGLSSVVALLLMVPAGGGLRVDRGALRWGRMLGIAGFMRLVLLQAVFWNIWFNADLILLQHLRSAAETGTYAAAKTIAIGFTLVPTAIAFVFGPRVARLSEAEVRGHLLRALALTAAVTVPLAIGAAAVAGPLTATVFGGRYADASIPLVVLLAGMVLLGLKTVLGSMWLGLGHPVVEAAASGAGMVVTLAMGVWLIPGTGAAGAAAAFSAGALVQLLVDGSVTVWAFGARSPRVSHLGDRQILAEERAEPDAARPVLLVAEELDPTADRGYENLVRALQGRLSDRLPTVLHAPPRHPWEGRMPVRALNRGWQIVRAGRLPELSAAPPAMVVYASRSSLTLPALVRARLLKSLCRGAPLAFVTLQSSAGRWPPRALRQLAPDLLLLPTDRECHAAARLGIAAATVCDGVDLERFRPPAAGERVALRRKWRLSPKDRIVLHVGPLRGGRGLQVMARMATLPGVTAVMAAGSARGPESEQLRHQLQAGGVVVIDGYVPQVEELYRLADCYLFPTASRDSAAGLPLSILEALASDLPVVSVAFGALSERFGSAPGLELVEDPALLPERALAACGSGAHTRHLVESYAWDMLAGRLVDLWPANRGSTAAGTAAPVSRGAA